MEEDIKIIENSIKEVEDNKDIGFFKTKEDLKFYNAVKHLLKVYKEKEADLYSANSIISEQIDIINNSVSKDKIKEIIDELEITEENNEPNLSKRYDLYVTRGFSSGLIFTINKLKKLLKGD